MAKLQLVVEARKAVQGARQAESALDGVKRSAFGAEKGLDNLERSGSRFGRTAVLAFGAAATAVAAYGAVAVSAFRGQSRALAEVGTLLDGNAEQIEIVDAASKRFVATYGGTATQQVEAFYQAISAGVGDAVAATSFLEQANTLALAGVTDITTAVNLLTSALNTYGASGLTAAEASDVLFLGVKAGKTTIDELNSALGRVLPVSAAAGVGFQEVVSGVAALTTGGLSTAEAVTALRGILAQIIKPTKEAEELSKALGIEFNTAGLEALGFAGFLEEVIEKTGGSTDAIAKLFSSQEALVGVLAFSGEAGEKFTETLGQMSTASGTAAAAAAVVGDSLEQRFQKQLGAINASLVTIGEILFGVMVPALETTVSAVSFVADNADILGVALIGLAGTAIPSVVSGLFALTAGFSASTAAATLFTAAVTAARVAVSALGGPIGLLAGAAAAAAGAFLIFRDNGDLAKDTAFNAAAAMAALNGQMELFYQTSAPSAGKAAIDLAQNNVTLAKSALDAAAAQLEFARAKSQAAQDPESALLLGEEEVQNVLAYRRAINDLAQSTAAARRTISQVSGAQFSGAITLGTLPPVPPVDLPSVNIPDAIGSSSSKAATEVNSLRTAYESLISELQPSLAFTDEYQQSQDFLNEAFNAGVISADEYATAMGLVEDRLKSARVESDQLGKAVGKTMADIVSGSKNARDAVSQLLSTLANQALTAGFQGIFGGLFGSGINSLFGFNARGTNWWTGGPTVVGEEGPEIVNLPAGTVISSASRSASGPNADGVVFNIDARGAQQGVAEQIRIEMQRFLPEFRQLAFSSVRDASNRGYG